MSRNSPGRYDHGMWHEQRLARETMAKRTRATRPSRHRLQVLAKAYLVNGAGKYYKLDELRQKYLHLGEDGKLYPRPLPEAAVDQIIECMAVLGEDIK